MIEWDESFMDVAEIFAKRSSCIRRQVGAVLVKDKRILSTGYNGTPPGFTNCCKVFVDVAKPRFLNDFSKLTGRYKDKTFTHHEFSERYEIHAEQNCLAFAAKNGIVTNGCTLYVTTAPCVHCAKLIVAAGIEKVVFRDAYKNVDGLDFLNDETDVEVYQMVIDNKTENWLAYNYNTIKERKNRE